MKSFRTQDLQYNVIWLLLLSTILEKKELTLVNLKKIGLFFIWLEKHTKTKFNTKTMVANKNQSKLFLYANAINCFYIFYFIYRDYATATDSDSEEDKGSSEPNDGTDNENNEGSLETNNFGLDQR